MRTLCIGITLFAFCAGAQAGFEQLGQSPYTVDLGGGSISGAGRLIRVSSAPVTVNGQLSYFNLDLDLNIQADGSIAAKLISAAIAGAPTSPSANTYSFSPGIYIPVTPNPSYYCTYTLSTPTVGADGRRFYSFTVNPSGNCSANFGTLYTWVTGSAQGNSLIGLRSTDFYSNSRSDYAYGLANDGIGLIRASVIGNTLTIQSVFSNGDPGSSVSFTKAQ